MNTRYLLAASALALSVLTCLTTACSDEDERPDPLSQSQEEATIQLSSDPPDVPGHAPHDR